MRAPLVLLYHAVDRRTAGQDPDNLFVPVAAFRRQLDLLAAKGFTAVTVEQYLHGPLPAQPVLLTFDDAYVSTLEHAAPALAERGWPAVVYASSQHLGRTSEWNADPDEPLLCADGLRALVAQGWQVGAHARHHVDMRALPAQRLHDEVAGSRQDLAALLGTTPSTFAYPFGRHDAAARAAVEQAGYEAAFAVHAGTGRFAIPRVDVNALDTERTFLVKTTRAWVPLRRALSASPGLRRAAHSLAGYAAR